MHEVSSRSSIPRIPLTHYINTSTKTKWQLILSEVWKDKDGHIDTSVNKNVIRGWPLSDLPSSCKCSSLCEFSGRSVYNHLKHGGCGKSGCGICSYVLHPDVMQNLLERER
jgi:hypothetical protein